MSPASDAERLREVLTVTPDSTVIGPVGGGAGAWRAGAARRTVARPAAPGCASAALDDDAPLPPSGASSRANRAIRSFASVGHQRSV